MTVAVAYNQEAQPGTHSHEDETVLFLRVIWVRDETAELICERRSSLLK